MWQPVMAGVAADDPRNSISPARTSELAESSTCGLEQARRLIGTQLTAARHEYLARSMGHNRIRVIRPGAVINTNHDPSRLNLILDDVGTLMTIRCG